LKNTGFRCGSLIEWPFKFCLYHAARAVCGVKVERVLWAEGQNQLTTAYQWFLAGWACRMSGKDVAVSFRVSWDHVYN
jgi:hypothetical protein